MTVFPIFRASPPNGPSSPAARAREEQAFYEAHCGPDVIAWVRDAAAALSRMRIQLVQARANNCDPRTCGPNAALRA